ncbi:hypothetical protein ACFOLJ_26130 [Rugamonas sp. CCM 8940]|uniref:hypothetical protein n=1 Tax=Rugamonas sp. CCM 8940 TaxID=2765359 RepID=UPI0018F41CDB|nr:hypothetical protein [Rugamonas sp. CCM 8940]MBJ7310018.1 hypothetical protein [Rugamonas sp. CCM 8940]
MLTLLVAACAAPERVAASRPASAQEEGRAKVDQVAAIILRDVQPLHGGQLIYLAADGKGYCQLVSRLSGVTALAEKRYQLAVPAEAMARLLRLAAAHAAAPIASSSKPGLPDAARPRIAVRLASGRSVDVSRWQHDHNAEFDELYQALLAVAQAAAAQKPLSEGRFDPGWLPDGF